MEWLVIDVVHHKTTGGYFLIIHASELKMMAEVICEHPIHPGDILYPVMDAMYLINKNEYQLLKVTNASAFSAARWRFLKELSHRQTATITPID